MSGKWLFAIIAGVILLAIGCLCVAVVLGAFAFSLATSRTSGSPSPAAAYAAPTAVPVAPSRPTNVRSPMAGVTPIGARKTYSAPPPMVIDPDKSYMATIETTRGVIHIQLLPQEAPKTVNNFVFLAWDGFYDGLTFHRVERTVIQGGDPLGNGTGGPGYIFEDELPVERNYVAGTVAMANYGPNTNGSQFFITPVDWLDLPKDYSIFGLVTGGLDVVRSIQKGDVMKKVTISEE